MASINCRLSISVNKFCYQNENIPKSTNQNEGFLVFFLYEKKRTKYDRQLRHRVPNVFKTNR